ncbi:efflux RND transporter periplasmic adaptor subunit [Sunxiuqinia sp. A32]|uniref:efflux RND transporter periplasmic adaptor subunit n=1 Tax=Sunxiuqinia sp. A32 TaxID=3461496 RepID=UPI0040454D94
MKRKKLIVIVAATVSVLIIAASIFIIKDDGAKTYTVKKGNIMLGIDCVGEVQGGKSTAIAMPAVLRDWELRVYSYKIVDLIQEGKTVGKGEYIAKLDDSGLNNNMRNKLQDKEKVDADLRNAVLDSTVRLTNFREQITNLLLDLEYQKIDLEQSKYESGAEQRRTEMRYQKAQIALDKRRRDYILEQNKLKIHISRYENRAERLVEEIEKFQNAIRATRIVSPDNGMVMFGKDYTGKKYTKDTEVQMYRPDPIAMLPDMSSVISEAYVKEIDVTKLHLNDSVQITIDALPDKEFTGKLVKIANMGEEHKNFDMKVFKVRIQFNETDPELKPGMTCSNSIVIDQKEDVLLVPVEAVFSDEEGKHVFVKKGGSVVRTNVELGMDDENNTVVLNGLEEGDKILLFNPEEKEDV